MRAVTQLPLEAADVLMAQQRLLGVAHRTPVVTSSLLDASVGHSVFLKCESLQRTGSFKFRGAYNMLAQVDPGQRERGVVTASSGNHAQAVALSARLLGCQATILMPTDAPPVKVDATRGYGARVEFFDRQSIDPEEHASAVARERSLTTVPAYDHPHIMAGNGTAALETLREVPDLDALVVPVGGGGVIAGSLIAAKHLFPRVEVYGVETEGADDTKQSFDLGRRVEIVAPTTIADGIRLRRPGKLTFEVVRALADDILVVSDDAVRAAVRLLLTRTKQVVEPSGAVPLAAVMEGLLPAHCRRIGLLITGGNIDPAVLTRLWDDLPLAATATL